MSDTPHLPVDESLSQSLVARGWEAVMLLVKTKRIYVHYLEADTLSGALTTTVGWILSHGALNCRSRLRCEFDSRETISAMSVYSCPFVFLVKSKTSNEIYSMSIK